MNNSESIARALCREYGIEEEAYVCREVPMYGPAGPVQFYYIPTNQEPAWQMFLPIAKVALSLLGKMKSAEE